MFRNTFEQGSRLYNPLRETLQKSRVQDPALVLAKSRVYDQMGFPSRISKRMRSLSPEQAESITKSTIVTEDRELVPTNNLWKVRGKEFAAVNIDVKEGKPLPPEVVFAKFGSPNNKIITSEVIYEMKHRHSHRSLNAPLKSNVSFRQQSPLPGPIVFRSSPFGPPSSIYYTERPIARVASPVRVKQNPTFMLNEPRTPNAEAQNSQKTYRTSSAKVDLDRISTNFKPAKQSSYKYNLFSSLDEAVNTGCGSCGGNEIIASKPNSYWG